MEENKEDLSHILLPNEPDTSTTADWIKIEIPDHNPPDIKEEPPDDINTRSSEEENGMTFTEILNTIKQETLRNNKTAKLSFSFDIIKETDSVPVLIENVILTVTYRSKEINWRPNSCKCVHHSNAKRFTPYAPSPPAREVVPNQTPIRLPNLSVPPPPLPPRRGNVICAPPPPRHFRRPVFFYSTTKARTSMQAGEWVDMDYQNPNYIPWTRNKRNYYKKM